MITFNGNTLLALHGFPQAEAPEVFSQDNHFAGIWGLSAIELGTGGRAIEFEIWLSDSSFTTAAAVDAYRQFLDLGVGNVGPLSITGNAPAFFNDCRFEGFSPKGSVLPAIGAGSGTYLQPGTYFQPGTLKFKQLSVP